jgi:toxin ParE1/3/4
MGGLVRVRAAELSGLRKWPVRNFENFLIFYLPRSGGVSIVRVLHGKQDWWQALGVI